MKKLKSIPIQVLLILSLLVASGCAVSSQQLLGSPNFVAEHLPRLLALEQESNEVIASLQMLALLDLPTVEDLEEMQGYFDFYWVYYHAANVYLSGGDQDLFVQVVARAELALQKIRDTITKSMDGYFGGAPKPETKPETLSL